VITLSFECLIEIVKATKLKICEKLIGKGMNLEEFDTAIIGHVSNRIINGNSAYELLPDDIFSSATAEISAWKGYEWTPLYPLSSLATTLNIADIFYKDEGPRFGLGSFKALGGAYAGLRVLQRVLTKKLGHEVSALEIRNGVYAEEVADITLVSATDGNHGRSLAWGAQMFGAPCRIFIHKEVSKGREQAMSDLGADVVRVNGDYDESVRTTRTEAENNGWYIVSDTSWEGYTQAPTDVMAGYGVMTDEIVEQVPNPPTHLFIQGGVGGLAASVTARLRQKMGHAIRIVVVEPELASCLFASGKSGKATTVTIQEETLMAGLSCGEPSGVAWKILAEEVADFLTIPEKLVAPTMRLMAYPHGNDSSIKAGESAVCGLAALISACRQQSLRESLGLDENSRVLIIGSEGVTDAEIYAQLVHAT
jgi:diaminopropionate ammonia-lyase